MLCSRCKKNPAVVFVSSDKNMSNTQGLCISCAKKLGIKPVNDLMERIGMSEDDINYMQEQLSDIVGDAIQDDPESKEGSENFTYGGATTFPFLKNLFSSIKFPVNEESKNNSSDKEEKKEDNKKKSKRKHIDIYCRNLNQKAKNNELDIIIGRETEINRVIQILCRRTKNNPCLVGEPGVGKTAIAEGLAIKIVNGDIPNKLRKKEIYLLDLTALVAGTQFRGQFESRIKGLIEEVRKDENIILFIDEVHNLVGAGDSEGSMSAANILKPSLSKGEIQVIGATTFVEYRKHIEKDSALERRFQQVKISEPTVERTITILKGIKFYYENYHRVNISDSLIGRLVVLSERYITDRFLPDKAIDLLDESCAYATLRNKKLEEYDKINAKIEENKLEEERLVGSEENTEADYETLAKIRVDIAKLEDEANKIRTKALSNQVDEKDISKVIELWTGIPAAKIQEHEFDKLKKLESKLNEKVIGQEHAIEKISNAIKRNRVQINPKRKPASFIFVGSTGVGKTELVKTLAQELFDTPDNLIRLDMSEYMEKHSVSRIIGSPPGYVGYNEAGQITEKVRQRPYSVLLFDEIEKAHPDIMNILLQILDEGKITDSHGREINFENTVIVMTSNAGSHDKNGMVGFGKSDNDLSKEKALKAISEFLRPEFLSRIDEMVVFNKLTQNDLKKISCLMLDEYIKTLSEYDVEFKYDEGAASVLASASYGGKNGARDLRNNIRKKVEDVIANAVISSGGFNMKTIILTGEKVLDLIIK
ncbi:MAG: ATP-dependent Clp protease ATP-binding subunit [Oscillospiraceae bacterium]|jgi:ATP-dependent Clp protease ATP-binding subunit ClpA|nr:ATP-dependent Clp protease ATP-binding subunit [Oscillospiraceae bacterium]